MKKYVVLLKGINLAGKNVLPMKDLVGMLEGLGCRDVITYIQSGNVVLASGLSAQALEKSISELISAEKGFTVPVVVLPVAAFKAAVAACPFASDEGKTLHYFFMESKPDSVNEPLLQSLCAESEQYELKGSVFYLYAPDGIGRSKLVMNIDKVLGVPATARNHNTVVKLLALADN